MSIFTKLDFVLPFALSSIKTTHIIHQKKLINFPVLIDEISKDKKNCRIMLLLQNNEMLSF
jgi:hypothetical protein